MWARNFPLEWRYPVLERRVPRPEERLCRDSVGALIEIELLQNVALQRAHVSNMRCDVARPRGDRHFNGNAFVLTFLELRRQAADGRRGGCHFRPRVVRP